MDVLKRVQRCFMERYLKWAQMLAIRRTRYTYLLCPITRVRGAAPAQTGASLRKATRFNAPRGSPAASARPAAVVSESIGIPPHL